MAAGKLAGEGDLYASLIALGSDGPPVENHLMRVAALPDGEPGSFEGGYQHYRRVMALHLLNLMRVRGVDGILEMARRTLRERPPLEIKRQP